MKPLPIMSHYGPDIVKRIHTFDEWDFARRRLHPFSGFKLYLSRNSVSLFRHWPHLLCWQWQVSYQFPWSKAGNYGFHQSGPGYTGGMMLVARLPLFGAIVFQRQASDRIAAFGEPRRSAPVIWSHLDTPAD